VADIQSLKTPVMVRLPKPLAAAVRRIAAAESESQSMVLRRLIRAGLDMEQRAAADRG
jgi:predicted transcriptional regulator